MSDTYLRCPRHIAGYNQYCYVVSLRREVYTTVASRCSLFGGEPVWLTDAAELDWLRTLLDTVGILCFHMGECLQCQSHFVTQCH